MENNTYGDGMELDLRRLWIIMINKWHIIIIAGVVGALLFGIPGVLKATVVEEILPTYESSTTIKISLFKENNEQVKAALELIRSKTVLDQVVNNLGLDMTAEELYQSIAIESQSNLNVFTLKIRAQSQKASLARDIADKTREIGAKFIDNSMDIKSFQVIEQANLPNEPVEPMEVETLSETEIKKASAAHTRSIIEKALVGGFLGVLSAMSVIFIQFALNDKIQTADDVERYLGKPVLASIPMMKDAKNGAIDASEDRGVK